MSTNEVKISVRNLIAFVLRSGDLDSRFMGASRAVEGTRAHQKIQKARKEEVKDGQEYIPEVWLSHSLEYKGMTITVEGRADGVLWKNDIVIVDEIKTTTRPLEQIDEHYNMLHWAQVKCYAYILATQNGLKELDIQLSYYQLDTQEIKNLLQHFSITQLKDFFDQLIERYFLWAEMVNTWQIKRQRSIKSLDFPFVTYRKGQRNLAVAVYKTIVQRKKLFVKAPTGIGKTISTLFPAVKAMGEGYTTKIFYLTAKTITRQVAEEAFIKMKTKGLLLKTITLTAKDKICFKDESNCNPEYCKFAKGHFDRVNDASKDIFNHENLMTREVIEKYARKYQICPFEFSLDMALWVDSIICDYNYVFDPRVYLKRFFEENDDKDYIFLIDEAHNLVDRSRAMFSAELNKSSFLDVKRIMKEKEPEIAKVSNKLNKFMLTAKKECGKEKSLVQEKEPKEIVPLLKKFINVSEKWLAKNEQSNGHKELLELYFEVKIFVRIAELYDERFVTYIQKNNRDVKIKLFCIEPSYLLSEAVKRGKTAVFFSATLTPLDYFRDMLGGAKEDYMIQLSAPFDNNNRCLLIANSISTKYSDRENTYDIIADYLNTVVLQKAGNYLVFFPSYKYMYEVYDIFRERYSGISTIMQSSFMTEQEREAFLDIFRPNLSEPLLGFAVLGGIFSEGIDLKGERLVGVVVVGVGLPQICLERDIIKNYFQNKNNYGFEYAYMYPGMNKVLQASGRVIRSEEDRGIILLIDERFAYSNYIRVFPREWEHHQKAKSIDDVRIALERFWC